METLSWIALVLELMEAEDAVNSGGAEISTLHAGYSGSGFVAGYYLKDAQTTFSVNAQLHQAIII